MRNAERLKNKLTLCVLGSMLTLFGGYLVYDRTVLPILSGVTEDRAGLTYRAEDPIFFWISVLMFGAIGGVIAGFGLWAWWNAIKPR